MTSLRGEASQGENAAGAAVEAVAPALSALRALRLARGLTQAQLAVLARVGSRTVYAIEAGTSRGRMDVRRRLLVALNVPHAEHRVIFGALPRELA
jgi:transcriptional regulator with XRE-family HTH domain